MDNHLSIYNSVRSVPEEALEKIQGGRLKGKTNINPMWRIRTLTEQFGPCGVGWKVVIKKSWLEPAANGEVAAFVEVDLFVKINNEWSEPIPGTGGSSFVAEEKGGIYVNDECFKMAFTDAISVACKLLGFGADVYWDNDRTKYDKPKDTNTTESIKNISEAQARRLFAIAKGETREDKLNSVKSTIEKYGYKNTKSIPVTEYPKIVEDLVNMSSQEVDRTKPVQ